MARRTVFTVLPSTVPGVELKRATWMTSGGTPEFSTYMQMVLSRRLAPDSSAAARDAFKELMVVYPTDKPATGHVVLRAGYFSSPIYSATDAGRAVAAKAESLKSLPGPRPA